MRENQHYQAASEYYGAQRARRSQVELMAHIDEGLLLLDAIGASLKAKEAFCIHPLLQDDQSLMGSLRSESIFQKWSLDPSTVVLAMEYRSVANSYLSHHYRGEGDVIRLSVLQEVNHMLLADKVQNRKDFEIYHYGSHEKTEILEKYFSNWLRALEVTESRYRELLQKLAVRGTAA